MLFGPAGACGRCGHLPGLVGVGVAGVFRERRCGRSSLCLWAVLEACEHVGAGLWLGLWAALWALVGGRLIVEKVRLLCAGRLGRQVAPRSLGSGQMTQDLTEFDRQGQGKQKEHPISLRPQQDKPDRLTVRYARRS